MVGIKTALLCWTLLFVCLLAAAAQVKKTITAESGDTVTLPCRAPNNRNITAVEWRRSDLTNKSVLLYRDNKYVPDEQDPSFKNRVDLQDVKDGDVSLILKNVTTHDTGTYECRVVQQTESHRRKRAVDTISSNYLRVVQKTITAESGGNVTLPCRAPNNRHITVVEWRRSDLTDKSVLLYWDTKYVPDEQDPSFKNRVALQDMKDGDVSLILKNVTTHDTGMYECYVVQQTESHRRKRAVDPISSNYLRVDPPGQTGGHTEDGGKEDEGKEDGSVRLRVGLSVCAVLLVAVVGFLIYRKHKQQNQDPYQPPAEQQQL